MCAGMVDVGAMAATLARVFAQSTSPLPGPRGEAEAFLRGAWNMPGFGMAALQVIEDPASDPQIRQACAINFKLFVKGRWSGKARESEDNVVAIAEGEKVAIKGTIVRVMLSAAPAVQNQLSDALAAISAEDFPERWPELLPTLVGEIAPGHTDMTRMMGVLGTANTIMKRYRWERKTDELLLEMKYVLDLFTKPLMTLLQALGEAFFHPPGPLGVEAKRELLGCVRLVFRIFFSMNTPDLPEEFEDHMTFWMNEFGRYLTCPDDPSLVLSSDPEKATMLSAVQAAVCENVNLYITKYEEEFTEYLPPIAEDIWDLLMGTAANTREARFDHLATSGIKFLTTVARSVHHGLFADEQVLLKVCESIVLPNVRLRESDEEMFEMNPEDFIRRDIEGSDSDTRRRMACELVKGLTFKYEQQVTRIFSGYVATLLAESAQNPAANWRSKDAAFYLVLALSVKESSQARGATSTSAMVDVGDFYERHVLPELQSPNVGAVPVVKADAIKFVTVFRSQLPKEVSVGVVLPAMVRLLGAESVVVHTYAANCVERTLAIQEAGGPRLRPEDVGPHLGALLVALFSVLDQPDSEANEYAMKCIMRVIESGGPGHAGTVAAECLTKLSAILTKVADNPMHPGFNHYLFESMAALVHTVCLGSASQVAGFEAALFPVFMQVLGQEVAEFMPYVFQIMSQMLEIRGESSRGDESWAPSSPYAGMLGPLVSPALWERPGCIPGLLRLVEAYLGACPSFLLSQGQLLPILGVFQKLISSKANDHHGFHLLCAIIECVPLSAIDPHMKTILELTFTRLQGSKTPKFIRGLLLTLSVLVLKHGGSTLVGYVERVQPGLAKMLLGQVYLKSAPDASPRHRRVCVAALGRLLSETPEVLQDEALWDEALRSSVRLCSGEAAGPPSGLNGDADAAGASEAGLAALAADGYSAAFAALVHARRADPVRAPQVKNPGVHLASCLARIGPGCAARVQHALAQSPEGGALGELLAAWLVSAGVTLA